MTQGDLLQSFRNVGIYVTSQLGGANYAVPTLAWLKGPCYDAFKAKYFADGIAAWSPRFNCRLFALSFVVFANECNALTNGGPANEDTLTLGMFEFIPDPSRFGGDAPLAGTYSGEGHAIWIALTEQGVKLVDPQSNYDWVLTETEKSSAREVFLP